MKRATRAILMLSLAAVVTIAASATVTARPLAPAPGPAADRIASRAPDIPARGRALESFGRMPLYFIENRGQTDEQVAFYVQGFDKTLYFTPDGVTFALTGPVQGPSENARQRQGESGFRGPPPDLGAEPAPRSRWAVRLEFVGANPEVRPVGEEETGTIISYFKGPKENWHTGLPTYGRIVYHDLWPGIDLAYYGTANQLKYEFVVAPGADPALIRLAYHGAESVELTDGGRLHVSTPVGGFADDLPVAYQEVGGHRVEVDMAFALDSPLLAEEGAGVRSSAHSFALGAYDPSLTLVLDPAILVYCGYIGGAGTETATGLALDSAGSAYVVGYTSSTEATFPVLEGPDLIYNGGSYDAFVAKVSADGSGLAYAGYIGGSGADFGSGIAVDSVGNAYLAGYTDSTQDTFPVSGGPDLVYNGGTYDAFVAKLSADGKSLIYAGYVGGTGWDTASGIDLNGVGNAYVTGYTNSSETSFPVKTGPVLTYGGSGDAFVAEVQADGTGLVYAGYIGGSGDDDSGSGIAVDSVGNAYVVGQTNSSAETFPVSVGPDLSINGGTDAFVAKVLSDGTGLAYAGYIGGSGIDEGYGIAVDGAGNAYVVGLTSSSAATFPVSVGPDLTMNGVLDAFVAEVEADGTDLVYAGYVGGAGFELGYDIAIDMAGNAFVIGVTGSSEATFPVIMGPDLTFNGGGNDAFVTKVRAGGASLGYAGYIGGSGNDIGRAIAVDTIGNAYVTGDTNSSAATLPVIGGPDLTHNGGTDAFVAKVHLVTYATFLPLVLRQ